MNNQEQWKELKTKEDCAKFFDEMIYTPTSAHSDKMKIFETIWNVAALWQAASQEKGVKGWIDELVALRNKLYTELPTGKDITTWGLLQTIKWFINDLDNFCSKYSTKIN